MSIENQGFNPTSAEQSESITSIDQLPEDERIALGERIANSVGKAGKVIALIGAMLGVSAAESQANADVISGEYQNIQTCWEGGQGLDEVELSLQSIAERVQLQEALVAEHLQRIQTEGGEVHRVAHDEAFQNLRYAGGERTEALIGLARLDRACSEAMYDIELLADELSYNTNALQPFAHMGNSVQEITVTIGNIQSQIQEMRGQ